MKVTADPFVHIMSTLTKRILRVLIGWLLNSAYICDVFKFVLTSRHVWKCPHHVHIGLENSTGLNCIFSNFNEYLCVFSIVFQRPPCPPITMTFFISRSARSRRTVLSLHSKILLYSCLVMVGCVCKYLSALCCRSFKISGFSRSVLTVERKKVTTKSLPVSRNCGSGTPSRSQEVIMLSVPDPHCSIYPVRNRSRAMVLFLGWEVCSTFKSSTVTPSINIPGFQTCALLSKIRIWTLPDEL